LAIDFTGHCRLSLRDTQRRIDYLRTERRDWFGVVLALGDAHDPGPLGVDIAADFGIDARCKFVLFVMDKARLEDATDAVEFIYRVFGTDDLIITWGNETIRPPLRAYAPMPIG
jgi:hypothetical protein